MGTQQEIEAILFASGKLIETTRIAEILQIAPSTARKHLLALQKQYEEFNNALQIINEDDAFKLHVKDTYLDIVSRVVADTEVSAPVMETLAIIAWRSPIVQSEVVHIRGQNAYDHIKELLEREFIVREPEGRSFRLRITEKFFEYFDVEGKQDIKEVFKEVEEAHRKKEMELELAHKKEELSQEQQEEPIEKLPDKKIDIDKLDSILEKSKKAREEMKETLPKEETPEDIN